MIKNNIWKKGTAVLASCLLSITMTAGTVPVLAADYSTSTQTDASTGSQNKTDSDSGSSTSASTVLTEDSKEESTASEMLAEGSYAKDELLVTFSDDYSNKKIENIVETQDADCEKIRTISDDQKLAQIQISDDDTMKGAIKSFQKDSRVETVQPNYKYTKTSMNDPFVNSSSQYYQQQFSLTNAEAAWDLVESGSHSRTLVAVIDTGLDTTHKDLQANIQLNSDGTYTRVVRGKTTKATEDTDQQDSHGTFVTGLIGATSNNNIGGSGIASGHQNDLVTVMTIGASRDGSNFFTADIVNAIQYAVKKGARVINMSLSGYGRDRIFESAVQEASDQNVVLVAASGNDNTSSYTYPADIKQVIGVNSTSSNSRLSYFSNYGLDKDISAFGENIISTSSGSGYARDSGTSFSSPLVAGIVALMLDVNSSLTPEQVYNILCATATGTSHKFQSNGIAYGNVNAKAAVQAAKKLSSSTALTSIQLKNTSSASLYKGDDVSLEYLTLPAKALASVTWKSSNPSVASVDSNGKVTGKKKGTAVITATATSGGVTKTSSCKFQVVKNVPMKSLAFSIPSGTRYTTKTKHSVELYYAPYNTTNLEIYLSSSNPDVVEINEDMILRCHKPGTAIITAKNYNGKVSASIKIKVCKKTGSIKITKYKKRMKVNKKYKFRASVRDVDGGTNVTNSTVTWTSSKPSVASVNKTTGVVKAKKAGKTTIRAYSAGKKFSAAKKVTIVK